MLAITRMSTACSSTVVVYSVDASEIMRDAVPKCACEILREALSTSLGYATDVPINSRSAGRRNSWLS